MIDSITRITLNLQETNTMVSIRAKRGDTGRKLLIHLSDGSIPYHISDDCYATFTAKKPDGTKINNACTIENNVIEYEFTDQTCTAVGTMKAEIRLYGADDKMITSACFLVNVYDTVFRDGDEVDSEGEMNALNDLILRANAFLNETGKLLRWQGNWDSETEYEANDLVLHEEVLYVAEEAIAAGTVPGSEEITAWVPIAGMGTGTGGGADITEQIKQAETAAAAAESSASAAKTSATTAQSAAAAASSSVSIAHSSASQAQSAATQAQSAATQAQSAASNASANSLIARSSSSSASASASTASAAATRAEEAATRAEEAAANAGNGSGGNVALTADQISALDGMFKIASFTADPANAYKAFKTAFGIADEEEPDEPVVPDEPEVTLTSISATYSGGDVAVGTALTDLTGIVVTAMYSDGTSETVTGYTLSGEIAEGSNTVTVSYGGKTTTFTVTGVAESGGDETDIHDGYISNGLEFRLDGIRNTNGERNTTDFKVWEDVSGNGYAVQAPSSAGGQILDSCYYTTSRCQRKITDAPTVLAKLADYTFEVVWKGGKDTSYGANGNIVRYGNGGAKWLIASNGQAVYNNTKYGTAVTYDEYIKHWTVTYDGANLVLYHEGVQDMSMEATMDITAESAIEFFGDSDWAQANLGYFYAARIYTRALSAEEVKANYDNDIARFGTVPVEVA